MSEDLFNNVCDEKLYASVFQKHAKDLHDFLYYTYGDHIAPKDKVQEAFVKLWERCKTVTPQKARSFLFTVANNLTKNELKHQKVVLKYATFKNATASTSSQQESPEFLMEEKQYLEKYQKALSNLTEPQRVAFLLNRIEGKTFKEIAAQLDISTKAVEKRIYGALRKLRKDIEGI